MLNPGRTYQCVFPGLLVKIEIVFEVVLTKQHAVKAKLSLAGPPDSLLR